MVPVTTDPLPQGYIVENRVTHIRGLPISSSHAFRYSTLSFLLGLNALESGQLDLGSGFVFSYGGRWGRLLGLRSQPYLNTLSNSSIRCKLEDQFRGHHMLQEDETFQDAWIFTMPSILGFEGINPLTVYFCYKDQTLWTVVLEIHNTFGESHVHLLEVGNGEDSVIARGYDHQWTFRRQFHVSPFNDRSGFYTVSVKSPGNPPASRKIARNAEPQMPLPAICVRLYTDPNTTPNSGSWRSHLLKVDDHPSPTASHERLSVGKLKLAAYLRTTTALPLTTGNVIRKLVKQPFVLFLTMPRILYHAWILHFSKRLDVFPRPEPYLPVTRAGSPNSHEAVPGSGVGWQEESIVESYAHRLVLTHLHRRTAEINISVVLTPSNPNILPTKISAPRSSTDTPTLEITYLSPRFFTILFTCPSSKHSLLFGSDTEEIFQVSSREIFTAAFSHTTHNQVKPSFLQGMLQSLRWARTPDVLDITNPTAHFLDTDRSTRGLVMSTIVLLSLAFLDHLEKSIIQVTGARFVKGREPWNAWKRAAELNSIPKLGKRKESESPSVGYGSVRRDDQRWGS
ncbi:hypothetical protein AN958_00639 [Leucoagaricus sp. SymC.cos]|nr:hypothetical protein AN958_00639 [Leucoagaricus sp. SymC.cos]